MNTTALRNALTDPRTLATAATDALLPTLALTVLLVFAPPLPGPWGQILATVLSIGAGFGVLELAMEVRRNYMRHLAALTGDPRKLPLTDKLDAFLAENEADRPFRG